MIGCLKLTWFCPIVQRQGRAVLHADADAAIHPTAGRGAVVGRSRGRVVGRGMARRRDRRRRGEFGGDRLFTGQVDGRNARSDVMGGKARIRFRQVVIRRCGIVVVVVVVVVVVNDGAGSGGS